MCDIRVVRRFVCRYKNLGITKSKYFLGYPNIGDFISRIAVVYWSDTGNTEAMAKAVVSGIKDAGGDASLIFADSFGPGDAGSYDAFAFGCPAMGTEVLEEDVFEPMFASVEGSLSGKKVLLFGSYDWGDGLWMREWADRASSDGADVVGSVIAHLDEIDENELKGAAARLV